MENIQVRRKRFRRRCNACKERISLYIFKKDGILYCTCPKCGVQGKFTDRTSKSTIKKYESKRKK